ncbi:MAG: 2TM domain-containing protein [Microbacteriaceae bacterium]
MEQPFSESELREAAHKSLKAKRDFWQFLFVAVMVSALVTFIYFMWNPGSFFWPMWVYFGMAIATFFTGLNAYGPSNKFISEEKIQREMRRLKGE